MPKIISDASRDAEAIRQQAYRDGYEHGVVTSIETVNSFIEDKQGIVNELYGQVRQRAKRLLSDTVNKESVICALFESWADEIDGRDDKTPFYILLPSDRRRYKRRLMAYIDSMHRGASFLSIIKICDMYLSIVSNWSNFYQRLLLIIK